MLLKPVFSQVVLLPYHSGYKSLKMKTTLKGYFVIMAVHFAVYQGAASQTTLPEILFKGTIKEQMSFIQERTKIYNDYRAIREDMFQRIKTNTLDSLIADGMEIRQLNKIIARQNELNDSLRVALSKTAGDLNRLSRTKNSISVLGIGINKVLYNAIMWIIISGLVVALGAGFAVFKHNRVATNQTRKDFEDLKSEFEAYRKSSREAREKMSMAHFNEIRKLKGI